MAEVVLVTTTELQPGAKLDQFTIVKAIGQGAFSEVFLAEDPNGQQVVLKCPHESIMGDVATFDRFRREVEIARHLHHPGIQRPIEFTTDRSRPYMVMEYIDGETLRALLSREKQLPVDKAVDFGQQLAAAMAHAHEQGVVHRDLKPGERTREPGRAARRHGLRRGLDGRRTASDLALVLHGPGNAGLHVARADPGQARRRPDGRLCHRCHALRDAGRARALGGRQRPVRHEPAHQLPGSAAARVQRGRPSADRRDHSQVPAQVARRAI